MFIAQSAGSFSRMTAVEEEQSSYDKSFLDFDPRRRVLLIPTYDRLVIWWEDKIGVEESSRCIKSGKGFCRLFCGTLFATGMVDGEGAGIRGFGMPVENGRCVGVSQRKIELWFSSF